MKKRGSIPSSLKDGKECVLGCLLVGPPLCWAVMCSRLNMCDLIQMADHIGAQMDQVRPASEHLLVRQKAHQHSLR
jgi:hypothetical protein